MRTIVVLGASADPAKYGNRCVRMYASAGWRVLPVNPKGGTIEGLPVLRSLDEVDEHVDRLSLYLPPARGVDALPDIARVKPDEVFVNPGAESPELSARAAELGVPVREACALVALSLEA
ncbi:MAG: CoA-binding protein [Planctomycetota bacterium]|nr:MAG: CoA-binding protein [Planctomycetota bacterium]